MKKNKIQFYNTVILFFITHVLLGCNVTTKDISSFQKAKEYEEQQNYTQAILFLNQAIDFSKDPQLLVQIAKKGLDILKQFTTEKLKGELLGQSKSRLQINYLRLILLYSQNKKQRISSQKSIADIYFSNIKDYHKSIEELSRLLTLDLPEKDVKDIQLKITKSYYHIGNFQQAKIELQKLEQNRSPSFETLLLKGDIFLGERNYNESALIFEDIIKSFPKKAVTDKVFLTLSLCYEEQKEFQKAISLLSNFLNNNKSSLNVSQKQFIAMKIERLKATYKMQPGVFQFGQTYRR